MIQEVQFHSDASKSMVVFGGGTAQRPILKGTNAASEVDVDDFALTPSQSGKSIFIRGGAIDSDLTISLPSAADHGTARNGCSYKIYVIGDFAASYDIKIKIHDDDVSTAYWVGGLSWFDTDKSADDAMSTVESAANNTIDYLNLIVPKNGTWVEIVFDGTNWLAFGHVNAIATPTFAAS